MELRPLGSTGITVSALGLGTVKLGRNRAVKYPGGEGAPLPTDDQATALLRTAADLGINLLDTAPAYGTSEERLGALMAANGWFGGRARWVLCTKAGEEFDAASGESRYDFSAAAITASVERSLRRLRTDVLDVALLHCDGHGESHLGDSEGLAALRALKERGLIRAIGASPRTIDGALATVRKSEGACDVVMLEYTPAHRAGGVAIDAARLRGAAVLVKKALGSGHIADLMPRMPPDIRATTSDPVEAALRFTLCRQGVSSVIIGTASPDHLRANIAAADRALGSGAI